MNTAIVDIDGICFDPTERIARCVVEEDDTGQKIDWDRAFSNEEVRQDSVIDGAPWAVQRISERYKIIYLTGRSYNCFEATQQRLNEEEFPPAVIDMRVHGDITPDAEFKKQRIENLRVMYNYAFVAAVDDDYKGTLKPMYESLGIPCFTSFDAFFFGNVWCGYGVLTNTEALVD